MRYKAFITYSHQANPLLAARLQQAVQTFAKPYYKRRAVAVFRDTTDLSAHPLLWTNIQRALQASEFLILMASPEAAASPWVKRELDEWLTHRPADTIIVVWVSGRLHWDRQRGDFDWTITDAVPRMLDWQTSGETPRTLHGLFREEPFHLDLTWAHDEVDMSLRRPQFLDAVASIVAVLQRREKSDLIALDAIEHRRFRRVRGLVVAMLVLLSIASLILAAIATVRQREAEAARADAEANAARNQLLLYDANMMLAGAAFEARAWTRGFGLLEQQIPSRPADDLREFYWRYLWHTNHNEEAVFQTASPVGTLAFVETTGDLVTGHEDGTITLWNLRNRTPIRTFGGKIEAIDVLSVSRDGLRIATSSVDGLIATWRGETGAARTEFRAAEIQVLEDAINVGVFSRDLRRVATTIVVADGLDPGKSIEVWDVETGAMMRRLTGHDRNVFGLAFSADGRTLVSGSTDGSVKLWDVDSGRRLTMFTLGRPVRSVAIARDRPLVAVGTDEGRVAVWDRGTSRILWTADGHYSYVRAIAISPDDRLVASGSDDGAVIVWDMRTGEEIRRLLGHVASITSVAFSPNGASVVAASVDGTVRLWRTTSSDRFAPPNDASDIFFITLSKDAQTIATSTEEFTVLTVWDVAAQRPRWRVRAQQADARFGAVTFSPNNRLLVAIDGSDRAATARVWEVGSGNAIETCRDLAVPRPREAMASRVAFSPDSRLLAMAYADGTLRVCDLTTGRASTTATRRDRIAAIGFLADVHRIAVIDDEAVAVWDLERGVEIRRVAHASFQTEYLPVAWSRDGLLLATVADDDAVRLWDLTTLREIDVLRAQPRGASCLAFSNDGLTLAAGGSEVIKLWDLRTRRELATIPLSDVYDMQFAASGRTLSVVTFDDGLRLLHGATNDEVSRLLEQRARTSAAR